MKKLLLILLCLPFIGFGQFLTPSLVSSSGNTLTSGNVIIDYSIGEIVINTYNSSGNILTQGFHQEILQVSTEITNIDIPTKVYPNPTTSTLKVELDKSVNAELLVYDLNGKIVIKEKLNNEQNKELDFSSFRQGSYLLHINIADKKSVYKIQKVK